jgi:hypothetical protein
MKKRPMLRTKLFPTGYAGICKKTGVIVDRRQVPDSYPLPKNPALNTPTPKKVAGDP